MLEQWTPEATVTVGSIFAGVLFLLFAVVRTLGKRADPELIKLSNRTLDAFSGLSTSIDQHTESNREQSQILGDLIKTGAASNKQIVEALQAVVATAKGEHESMQTSLGVIIDAQTEQKVIAISTQETAQRIEHGMKTDSDRINDMSTKIDALIEKIAELVVKVERLGTTVVNEVTNVKGELATTQLGLKMVKNEIDVMKRLADSGERNEPTVNLPVHPQPKEPEYPAEEGNDDL